MTWVTEQEFSSYRKQILFFWNELSSNDVQMVDHVQFGLIFLICRFRFKKILFFELWDYINAKNIAQIKCTKCYRLKKTVSVLSNMNGVSVEGEEKKRKRLSETNLNE